MIRGNAIFSSQAPSDERWTWLASTSVEPRAGLSYPITSPRIHGKARKKPETAGLLDKYSNGGASTPASVVSHAGRETA